MIPEDGRHRVGSRRAARMLLKVYVKAVLILVGTSFGWFPYPVVITHG
jgi:hypothetical protein